MRSVNIGGRGWPKSEKVIADFPAPSSKRERLAVETALIQHYLSLGLPLKNRKIRCAVKIFLVVKTEQANLLK